MILDKELPFLSRSDYEDLMCFHYFPDVFSLFSTRDKEIRNICSSLIPTNNINWVISALSEHHINLYLKREDSESKTEVTNVK